MTDEELLDYSEEHLRYEIDMLKNVSRVNLKDIPNELKQLLSHTTLESFAVHLRNLITFLYPTTSARRTDIYARDFFFDQNKWIRIRPPLSETLKTARKRANKEVGHLTADRIAGAKDAKKVWKIKELADEIILILRLFSDSADKSKLDKSISKSLS